MITINYDIYHNEAAAAAAVVIVTPVTLGSYIISRWRRKQGQGTG